MGSTTKTVPTITPTTTAVASASAATAPSPVTTEVSNVSTAQFESMSGRTSTGSSSVDERSIPGSTRLSVDSSNIKCALCPQTFSDSAALQAHTLAHFDGGTADALIREKLLKSTKKKHKKKKRKKREQSIETIPPVLETVPSEGIKIGKKGKKVYACVLCTMT